MEVYLSVSDVADRVGIPLNTLQSWLSRGRFIEPDVSIGKTRGWSSESVDQWIEAQNPAVHIDADLAMAAVASLRSHAYDLRDLTYIVEVADRDLPFQVPVVREIAGKLHQLAARAEWLIGELALGLDNPTEDQVRPGRGVLDHCEACGSFIDCTSEAEFLGSLEVVEQCIRLVAEKLRDAVHAPQATGIHSALQAELAQLSSLWATQKLLTEIGATGGVWLSASDPASNGERDIFV